MKNNNDSIASEMNERIQSEANVSLFNSLYKSAKVKCEKCGSESCSCGDTAMADDNDAKKKKKEESKSESSSTEDSSKAEDMNNAIWDNADADDESEADDESDAEDANNDAGSSESEHDKGRYDTDGSRYGDVTASLDEAFAHLLSASAVLDTIGFEKSSAMSLNLAGFLVEAKKKVKDKKKGKSKDSSGKGSSGKSGKSSKDLNDAKKKKDSKSSGSSSSSSSSSSSKSKKPNPFAKKK